MAKHLPAGWKPAGNQLGEGGAATVYPAVRENSADTTKHAVKVLRSNAPDVLLARFYQEIDTIKKLSHPNIISVVESSKQGDSLHYYVMPFIEGAKSLRKLSAAGASPYASDAERSVELFIDICEGLDHCQSFGITHRDLSPANILILPGGLVKIIDFGLCHFDDGHKLTMTDENAGTPNYMAPECESFSSDPASIRSDLYSAGKILWSAMTGKATFPREERVFGPLSMREMFPEDYSSWHLHDIFSNTIRRDPKSRWSTAKEAVSGARRVLDRIRSRTLPIEFLATINVCPICRIGTMRSPDDVFEGGGGYTLFTTDRQPKGVVRMVCEHCGWCHLISRSHQRKTMESRQNLS